MIRDLKNIERILATTLVAASLAAGFSGCQSPAGPGNPGPLGEGRRVLFIGNSYLYTQNIPGIVQAIADSAGGDKLAVAMVVAPDVALIDHWNGAAARAEIAKGGWEWVVLQQGPSSTALNRDTLRLAVGLFAGEIAKVNARTVLFSAWPAENRRQDFPLAIESYFIASNDVGGQLVPVASAWLAAWARDASLDLYTDGLHPTASAAYLSSLVVYACLLHRSPLGAVTRLSTRDGNVVAIAPLTAAVLQESAAEVWQSGCSQP